MVISLVLVLFSRLYDTVNQQSRTFDCIGELRERFESFVVLANVDIHKRNLVRPINDFGLVSVLFDQDSSAPIAREPDKLREQIAPKQHRVSRLPLKAGSDNPCSAALEARDERIYEFRSNHWLITYEEQRSGAFRIDGPKAGYDRSTLAAIGSIVHKPE